MKHTLLIKSFFLAASAPDKMKTTCLQFFEMHRIMKSVKASHGLLLCLMSPVGIKLELRSKTSENLQEN